MNQLSQITPRKFIESFIVEDWNIETDSGFVPITNIHKTIKYQEWIITTESGFSLTCADTHIIFDENFNEIYVKDCKPNFTKIITKNGIELVSSVKQLNTYSNMYDVTVDSQEHRFYTGDILSHNSSMIECITFALYGKAFRKISKNNLINSINKSDLIVELDFKIGNIVYKIIRGIKPNIFEVYCNGVLIQQDAKVKDYQEHLERYILKMNYKSFTQVVILGSARYTPFMQLSSADRRSVIENLLDIQIFSNMNIVIKDKLSNIKETLQQLKYDIELDKEKINIQLININDSKKNSNELIEKKKENINTSLKEIETLQKNIDNLIKINNDLNLSISNKHIIESKKNKFSDIYVKLKNNIKNIEKDNIFYESNDSCPVCKQDIDKVFKNSIIDKNIEKKKELYAGKTKLETELENIKKSLDEIIEINNKINFNNTKISELNSTLNSSQKYINILNKEIVEIEEKFLSKDSFDSKLNSLNGHLETLTKEYSELLDEKKYFDFISVMLKDGGIKTNIIKQYLPLLNKYINQYLSLLDFFVNFNITEDFEEIIKSRHRDDFSYSNFSEGEKTRLDLAILFSFRQLAKLKNSVNTNLLILDEIFESSLDANGIQTISNLLSTLDDSTNIFVISHKTDDFQDKFDRVISFEKVKNFSKIKVL